MQCRIAPFSGLLTKETIPPKCNGGAPSNWEQVGGRGVLWSGGPLKLDIHWQG